MGRILKYRSVCNLIISSWSEYDTSPFSWPGLSSPIHLVSRRHWMELKANTATRRRLSLTQAKKCAGLPTATLQPAHYLRIDTSREPSSFSCFTTYSCLRQVGHHPHFLQPLSARKDCLVGTRLSGRGQRVTVTPRG